ncbi:MAG: elongation factor P [Patescibacteria group bacterium]|nr:elongation factor P [Patescibacteria group bacterium]
MISVTELRSGSVFEDSGQIFQVLSYEHIKMGRGSANIKVKVRNVRSLAVTEKSFINGAKVKPVTINKRDLQYLYKDSDSAYFMDSQTFEQLDISLSRLSGHEFLKMGENFSVSFLGDEPLYLNLPPKMEFKIIEAEDAVKGNSVTNIFKNAVLESGTRIRVPLFIKVNDKILIDTRDGTYSAKAP